MDEFRDFLMRRFEKEVRAHLEINSKKGTFSSFPPGLDTNLREVLENDGIKKLYTHQREAFESISADTSTLLVSHTASGKTLSFFLPILNEYLAAPAPFSVLLLYPTKALSRDQESTFGKMMSVVKKANRLGTFDGDTPRDERSRIQQSADFIITNPDMLHSGILPNHNRRWKSFLSRLRYIVVDEVHIYRGAFGSHVSNVFRRLMRICAIHGCSPVFVCSSATVGNPADHVRALFHQDFHVIDKDGAPRPDREFFFINPPLVQSHGHALYRKGPASVTVPLLREAVRRGIRTICFCRARQEVERLYRAVCDRDPSLAGKIKPYRGGLLPGERRRLERDLVEGRLTAIITTNALELGIDIGDLDLCLLSGHPGTVASFWQQAGRVGRRGKGATIVYVAKDSPIDQFLVHHPEFITRAPIEEALLNADNPYIMLQHLPCAAHEYPLRQYEELFSPMVYEEAVSVLKEEKALLPYHETLRYALQDYPARGVNLRGMTDYNVEIICRGEVIGEIDPIGARGTLYKDAIYQHLGRKYMSMDLDLEKKICMVEPVEADYFTEAVWHSHINLVEEDDAMTLRGAGFHYGYINVNKQPKLYKKIRERSYENIGYGPITLAAFEYDTTGFSMLAPRKWVKAMEEVDKRYVGAALFGLSYLLKHTAPLLCMADVKDMATDVSLVEEEENIWKSSLYLYDAIEGGVGYSEKVYENIEECLLLCETIVRECDCETGCPSCVPPLPPGIESEDLEELLVLTDAAVKTTLSLLKALVRGRVELPRIKTLKVPLVKKIAAPPEDEERKKMGIKMDRASKILRKKRERLH